jgi:large subunit ribosomal protein L9
MEIILLEKVEKLGQMGDVVNVKAGFARNFLLPHAKALRATEANKKHFDVQRAQLEANNLKTRSEAEKLGEKFNGLSVAIVRQAGEAGQLYGSVNARDIANCVTESGFTISRQQVELPHPIKALGLYDIRITLHPEISVIVSANIARSNEEAKIQAKTGVAVVSSTEEENKGNKEYIEDIKQTLSEQSEEIFEEGAIPEPQDLEDDEIKDEQKNKEIQEDNLD